MFHDSRPLSQHFTICFTICLFTIFISPDIDGHRAAPKNGFDGLMVFVYVYIKIIIIMTHVQHT